MEYCAPGTYDEKIGGCMTLDQLVEIAVGFNAWLSKNPSDKAKINIINDGRTLLRELLDRFKDVCDNEHCITQQEFMNEIVGKSRKAIQSRFRSNGPKTGTDWLITTQINDVMEQYEYVYPEFKFIGAVALNCNEVNFCPLYSMSFDKLYGQGIRKIGVVYNLDKYGQPGSHWVSLYADLEKGIIYYSDSAGKSPNEYVYDLVEKFKTWCKSKNKTCNFKYNKKKHQHDNSECGVYSSTFIIRLLNGESFEDIERVSMNFKEINSCRLLYFATADTLEKKKYDGGGQYPKIDPRCDSKFYKTQYV